MFQILEIFLCLKLLATHVPTYHEGTQTTSNILLQLSKGKQGSAISGVVEKECPEFLRERFYKNTSESFHLRIYILRLVFSKLKKRSEYKELNHAPTKVFVLL